MRAQVEGQGEALPEALERALERPLSSVDHEVSLQLGSLRKCLPALRAHVVSGPVDQLEMLSQGIPRLQLSWASALRTNEFLGIITFSMFYWLASSKFRRPGGV